jgi:hypothetical protein
MLLWDRVESGVSIADQAIAMPKVPIGRRGAKRSDAEAAVPKKLATDGF